MIDELYDRLVEDLREESQPRDPARLAVTIRGRADVLQRRHRVQRVLVACTVVAMVAGSVAIIATVRGSGGPRPGETPTAATPGQVSVPPADAAQDVTISALVFSGVRDPAWDPAGSEAADLVRVIESLDTATGRPPRVLGVRGFLVDGLSLESATGPATVEVQATHVVVSSDSGRTVLDDPNGLAHGFLMSSARAHLEPELYEIVVDANTDSR